MILEEQIIPHPYTYLLAKAIKEKTGDGIIIRWFDIETGKELSPFFGYGAKAQELVDDWYKARKDK